MDKIGHHVQLRRIEKRHGRQIGGIRASLGFIIINSSSSLLDSRSVRRRRRPQHADFCAALFQIVPIQYLFRSSLRRLAGLPLRLCLSYGLQVVTSEVHRSSLRRLVCPVQDHYILFTLLVICITIVLSLIQMIVLVRDAETTSFHFGLGGRKFVRFTNNNIIGERTHHCDTMVS